MDNGDMDVRLFYTKSLAFFGLRVNKSVIVSYGTSTRRGYFNYK